ncbi:MAG: ATP-binding protein [Gemmatimonadaceae bacterium]
MRLTQRLLLGSLLLIAAFLVFAVVSLDRRLGRRLRDQATAEVLREARVVALQWQPGVGADSLADAAGKALSRRVTLIAPDGTVLGDSEFDSTALGGLENHATRPEIVTAVASGEGTSIRQSRSAGDEEVYAAVRAKLGVARVSASTRILDELVNGMQQDVLAAGGVAALAALVLALLFARTVARPILELRDDARAIAGGDLSRRPSLSAPGEVGELATAFHRLAEELSTRLQALEADDALLRALTESLNEGVVAIDETQRVVHLNDHARRLLGIREQTPFPTDQLPRDRVLREAILGAGRGEHTDAIEMQLAERTVALTVRPRATGGAVLALYDLTPIRRLETVRRDFVANVSHELKTPLTVISGVAETLQDEQLPLADRQRFLEMVLANARRMQRIVDDLLDLSRIESGGWVPNPSAVDLTAMASEIFGAVRDRAATRGVTLIAAVPDDARELVADPTAVRQVLANLTDNAVRHTTLGSITLFARRVPDGTVIGVRDTGSGIPAEHLPRIFERFYRADAARSREEGGTGLGLAIVKHMVEAHGGRVSAESQAGRGTTIEAFFPLAVVGHA